MTEPTPVLLASALVRCSIPKGLKRTAKDIAVALDGKLALVVGPHDARRILSRLPGEVHFFQVVTLDRSVYIIVEDVDDLLTAGLIARRAGVQYSVKS